jgi:hypothetical protein
MPICVSARPPIFSANLREHICLSTHPPTCKSSFVPICLFAYLANAYLPCPPICSSTNLPICRLHICLFACLFVCFLICVADYGINAYLRICPSASLPILLCTCLPISTVYISACLPIRLPSNPSICLFANLHICLLPIWKLLICPLRLSAYPPIFLTACLPICLSSTSLPICSSALHVY